VFKELREQNHDFFREYYSMHDLKEQREKLGRLIQAYRAGGSAAPTGARAPEAAPTAAAVMGTDAAASMEWSRQQTEEDTWLDGELARLLARSSTGGGVEFAGAALPHQQAVHCPGGQQQPHDDQQAVYNDRLREMGWAEEAEAVAAPTLAQQQLQNEQPVANGLFQGVAWPLQAARSPPGQQLPYQQEQAARLPAGQKLQYQQEQAARLLTGQQLQYQQEQAAHLPAGQQPPYHEQTVYFPADQQPRYPEHGVHLPAGQQLTYQEQGVSFPADQQLHYQEQDLPARQQLHYQQQAVHLPAEQQAYYCQEQLMANNGGFQGAPAPTLAAGLPSDILMDPWPLSQDGIVGWGQEQQAEPPGQRWPGAGADPSPSFTLPGGEQLGNQNFYGGSNGGRVQ
jgi:hypothetical protein